MSDTKQSLEQVRFERTVSHGDTVVNDVIEGTLNDVIQVVHALYEGSNNNAHLNVKNARIEEICGDLAKRIRANH